MLTDLYHTGKLGLNEIIEKMTSSPAKAFNLNSGVLEVGAQADIMVMDPELEWTVDEKQFYTRGSHSPFVGRKLKGKAVATFVSGKLVMKDGKITC